jgi:YHS domain-containing protein
MKNQFFSRHLLLAAILSTSTLVTIVPELAFAYDETSTSALNVDKQGVAIKGFDPVAYFTDGAPLEGTNKFTATYKGATYHFANAKNRDAFKANSEKFVPQYGGFCAMGVALGKKLDGDPQAWRVVDNKLYLNVNKEVQKKWLEDVPGNLKKADSEWPQVSNKAPKDL